MTYERFIVLNDRIKYNNDNFKVVILNIIDKEKVKIRKYEKERKLSNPRQKVWCMKGDSVVCISDLINSITRESVYFISNPSKLKDCTVFKGKNKVVINYELMNDIYYKVDSRHKKNLVFKTNVDKDLNVILSKNSIKGCLKHSNCGSVDIFETESNIFIVGNNKMCCVDGQHLFEDWNLKSLDLTEVDFSECDTLYKAFDTAYIDNLILDFNCLPNLRTISYAFIYSKIKQLSLYNLDFTRILNNDDLFFKSYINTLNLINCNFGMYIERLNDINGLTNFKTDSKYLDNVLNKIVVSR